MQGPLRLVKSVLGRHGSTWFRTVIYSIYSRLAICRRHQGQDMTVREWLNENLPLLHRGEKLDKVYRRSMKARQYARMYAGPDSAVLGADVKRHLDEGE